jgi:hypothetical protein
MQRLLLGSLVIAVTLAAGAAAQPTGGATPDTRVTVIGGHLFGAGNTVRATDGAADDAFLAGSRVFAAGTYQDDLFAAGRAVTVAGEVQRDVFGAGGTVEVERTVGDDAYLAGGTVTVREGARIAGDAFLAGSTVEVFGGIGGDLWVGGSTVTIAGTINGNVTVRADTFTLAPSARINGSLTYTARQSANVSTAAVVTGGIRAEEPERRGDMGERSGERNWAAAAGWSLGGVIGLLLLGAVLQWAFPQMVLQASDTMGDFVLRSFGLGIVAVIGLPLAGLILLFTIIGIPLGLLLWFVLAVLLASATVIAAYGLGLRGRVLFARTLAEPTWGARIGWTLVGLVVLAVLSWVPLVGGLIVWLFEITALGALVMTLWTRFRSPRPVSAAI